MGHLHRRLRGALAALALGGFATPMQAAEVELLGGRTWRAGERMDVALAVRDPTTRWPLDGLAIRAWLRAPLEAEDACLDLAGRLARGGGADPRRALALDAYDLLALAWSGERLVALTPDDGMLAVLDPSTLEARASIAISGPATALALVEEQDRALVTDDRSGVSMAALEAGAEPLGRLPLGIAADRLAVAPGGRWLFALDRGRSTLAVLDLAHGRVAHALTFEDGAEELLVGPDLLYVRLREAPAVAILALASLAADREPVIERVVMGSGPAGGRDRLLMTLGPGGCSLHLAHPVDRRVYLVTGGSMRAPVSAVPLKGVAPAALVLRPRQPQPMGDGVYRAVVKAPRPGRYSVVVALDRPPEAHCIELAVQGEADPRSAVLASLPRLEAELTKEAVAGRETTILLNTGRGPGREPVAQSLGMVGVMALRVGGSWQQRTVASPLGQGRYTARLRFPAPGRYLVLAEAPAVGLDYGAGPRLLVEVHGEPAP